MDASEYKEYIISMLLLKRVNDQFEVHRDKRKKTLTEVRGVSDPKMIYGELERQNAPEYDFFIPLAALICITNSLQRLPKNWFFCWSHYILTLGLLLVFLPPLPPLMLFNRLNLPPVVQTGVDLIAE